MNILHVQIYNHHVPDVPNVLCAHNIGIPNYRYNLF